MTGDPPIPDRTDNPSQPGHPSSEGPGTWDRVHALFHQALELEPPAREDLIRQIEATDPALAAEVRSLLASHEMVGDFLSRPPTSPFAEASLPGDKVGPYRLLEEIGHGGMGVVFRAVREDEHFSKEVAIKLISPEMRSQGILDRFRSERQILAMLDHPNIARLIDGGSTSDGSPYLVMEYVAGKPLLHYCDEKRLGIDERLGVFLTVCDAVQFAHQRLVVHRDLKSDNVLVTADGSPRLLDFGIAKLTSVEPGSTAAPVTSPMQRLLTPDYASPEQVRGEPVTVASDVYSLGVILYELLTGTRPFRFETRTPEEILRVVTGVDPDPPSSVIARTRSAETALLRGATVTRLRRHLAGDLDYIVLKALEKEPARRYGSVDQLARDIRRYLEKLPVLARGRTTAYLLSRLVRRHRVEVVTAGLVLLSLVAGLVGTAWQARVASRERDRAKRRFEEVRALARAVVFPIHDAIANLPGSTKAREILVFHALRYLDSLSKEASGDWGLQHELAVAYGKIGDVQGRPMFPNLGRMPDALRSYQRSLALLQSAAAACPDSLGIQRDLVVTMQRLGDVLGRMGRREDGMKMELDAKQHVLAQRALHPDEPLLVGDLGVATDRLSDLKFAAGDTLGAVKEISEGNDALEQLYRKNPKDAAVRRSMMVGFAKLAKLLESQRDRGRAGDYYAKSQALAEQAVQEFPNNTDASRDLGIVYSWRSLFMAEDGLIDSALVLHGRGTKIAEGLAASDPDDVLQQADLANGHFEVGTILMKGGRYSQAEENFAEAYRRFVRLAAHDTSNAETRVFLARTSRQAGEACQKASRSGGHEEAARWKLRARDWFQKSLAHYRQLGKDGALSGQEIGAPAEVSNQLAALQGSAGGDPDSSR